MHFTRDIMQALVASGRRVMAYSSAEYIKDIGTPARLRAVEVDWRAGRIAPVRTTQPAIFLDRDGTLNVEKGHLRYPEELQLLPGVGPALRALREAGFRLVVLTNQPVIARGEATESDVSAIHRRLEWELGKQGAYLDGIYICPHHPDGGFPGERAELKLECECRKPGTGLLERACRDLRIDVKNSWLVGDQTRDVETARRAGVRSILVQTGIAGRDQQFRAAPDHVAADLPAAANLVLTHMGSRAR
jgi:D,D-heptose 1,7-bisphosphate phosphatase